MSHDSFEDRRRALEDQFFQQNDQKLVEQLKRTAVQKQSYDELKKLTGIHHEGVLQALAKLELGAAGALVVSLFPLIDVAWADGKIDPQEKKTIGDLAVSVGLVPGSPAHAYLERWLNEKPELTWKSLWTDYVKALVSQMSASEKEALKQSVLGRARVVAEASGGLLGHFYQVSAAEKKVLAELATAFE